MITITSWDPSIPAADRQKLQFAYSQNWKWFDVKTNLPELFKKFAAHYTQTISHPGLRHAMLACSTRQQYRRITPVSEELVHAWEARKTLIEKFQSPASFDEGDLFVTTFLALWSLQANRTKEFDQHIQGVIAIMGRLRNKRGCAFTEFWPLIRDQITTAAEFRQYVSPWDTELEAVETLHEAFRDILGAKTAEQRETFEKQLNQATYIGSPLETFRQMTSLCILRTYRFFEIFRIQSSPSDGNIGLNPFVESALVDFAADVQFFDENEDALSEELNSDIRYLRKGLRASKINDDCFLRFVFSYRALVNHRIRQTILWFLEKASAIQELDLAGGAMTGAPFLCHMGDLVQTIIQQDQSDSIQAIGKHSCSLIFFWGLIL
jgi:hypothetical protein